MKVNSRFIVVKHDAKKARLHYDLRFVMPNSKVWASFAVRKGVPEKPGVKVLAVRTHDHEEKEALFLGTIKAGYGAGKLTKFDDGKCIIHKYKSSHMIVEFKGRKIKGIYHLINTGVFNKKDYKKQQFMLFKGNDLKEAMSIWGKKAYDPLVSASKGQYSDAVGLRSQIRAADSETDNEDADLQQVKPLKWSISKPQRIVAAEQLYQMLKDYII
jgi:DNA ligase D-like protein (predicted 3'-phosphoesterase)